MNEVNIVKVFYLVIIIVVLLLGCEKNGNIGLNEIAIMKEENKNLKEENKIALKTTEQLEVELDQQKAILEEVKEHMEKLKQKMIDQSLEKESYRVQLLFAPPQNLLKYYRVAPEVQVVNEWYVINNNSTIHINEEFEGYKEAVSVRFMYTTIGTDQAATLLYFDDNVMDGWSFNLSLSPGIDRYALWAEVSLSGGEIVRTPILPFQVIPKDVQHN